MPHILGVVAEACNPSTWKVQGEELEIQGHLWLQIQLKVNMGGLGQAIYFLVEGLSMKIVWFCLLLSRQGLLFPGWSWSHVAKDNLEFLTLCFHFLKDGITDVALYWCVRLMLFWGLTQGLIQVEQASFLFIYLFSSL